MHHVNSWTRWLRPQQSELQHLPERVWTFSTSHFCAAFHAAASPHHNLWCECCELQCFVAGLPLDDVFLRCHRQPPASCLRDSRTTGVSLWSWRAARTQALSCHVRGSVQDGGERGRRGLWLHRLVEWSSKRLLLLP